MLFDHSFLSEMMEFSVSFRKLPLPSIIALSFHTLKEGQLGLFPCKMLSTLISFWSNWFHIYFWKSFFYHPLLLAHSVLLRGLISLLPFKILFNHPLLGVALSTSLQRATVPVFIPESGYWLFSFRKFLLSSCIVPSFHATREISFYLHSLLWEGLHFHISFPKSFLVSFISLPLQTLEKCHSTTHSFLKGLTSLYFWKVSSIILHRSINPCL